MDTPASDPLRPGLARARQLLRPACLAHLLACSPDAALIEVGCGRVADFEQAHIPGAAYLDTSVLEGPPYFNKVDDDALHALLLQYAIGHDTTVLLYGRNSLAAARAAHLMLYAGVADVRLLDGGFGAWCAAGLPCSGGSGRALVGIEAFGLPFPACPHYLAWASDVAAISADGGATLVSVRTWREFSGATSGYAYIAARGEIPGARWGRAGREGDINSMSHYQLADGCMLPAVQITRMWRAGGIEPSGPVVFYCGTGWRASLAFFYAWLMGWERIAVYDGGWCEWSANADNPVVRRLAARGAAGLVAGARAEPAPVGRLRQRQRAPEKVEPDPVFGPQSTA